MSKFDMIGCKPILVSMEQKDVKMSVVSSLLLEELTMYRSIVDSLIHMTITRIDLSYVVGFVSQFKETTFGCRDGYGDALGVHCSMGYFMRLVCKYSCMDTLMLI